MRLFHYFDNINKIFLEFTGAHLLIHPFHIVQLAVIDIKFVKFELI